MSDVEESVYAHLAQLLYKDGKTHTDKSFVSASPEELRCDFRHFVEQFIWDNTSAEVSALDMIVAGYQERYNIVGSVSKAFYTKANTGKQYQALMVEQAILQVSFKEVRFMDWLLERGQYMNFSEVLPEYFDWLKTNHDYSAIIAKLSDMVCSKFDF